MSIFQNLKIIWTVYESFTSFYVNQPGQARITYERESNPVQVESPDRESDPVQHKHSLQEEFNATMQPRDIATG